MRASRARGMSLIEMLVAAGLLLMFFTLVAQVMIPSLYLVAQGSTRTGLQQQALAIMDRIERDLRRSSTFAIGILPAPMALSMRPLAGGETAFGGTTQWEPYVLEYYFLPATQSLIKTQTPANTTGSRPEPATPAAMLKMTQALRPGDATLARNARAFSVRKDTWGAYFVALELEEATVGKTQPERFALTRTIFLRNH